ncbi:Gfo/Idh/MocA family protein [Planctomycetota bacterium]
MRLGQIGYGYWGKNLARVFSSQQAAELVACCEPDSKARTSLQKAHPSIEICERVEDLVGRDDLDAIVIATPAGKHYEHARLTLNAGKHTFVEKPLALAVREASELVEMAERNKLVLMVGHTFLFNDAVRWIKDYVDRGEIGDVYYAYFQRLNLGRVRQDVDAMWNLAPHDISIAQFWYGETPTMVQAQGVSYLQEGIDDVCFLNLRFPSGRFAHIHVSWLDPVKTRRAVLVGNQKMVSYDDTAADQRVVVFDKGIDLKIEKDGMGSIPFDSFAQFNLIQRSGDILIPNIRFREPLQVQAQHFVACVKNGTRPMSGGRFGLDVVRTLEAAQAACRTSQPQFLEASA